MIVSQKLLLPVVTALAQPISNCGEFDIIDNWGVDALPEEFPIICAQCSCALLNSLSRSRLNSIEIWVPNSNTMSLCTEEPSCGQPKQGILTVPLR